MYNYVPTILEEKHIGGIQNVYKYIWENSYTHIYII